MNIIIIDYGAGNVQSICFALERMGYTAKVSHDKNAITQADRVIFPGVGHAQSAMEMLRHRDIEQILPTLQQPVLGICLGMQLLCNSSEEGGVRGFGIFDTDVVRFSAPKVPQVGWNTLTGLDSPFFEGITESDYVYMVHSYYVPLHSSTIAKSCYGLPYSAAVQKDNFFGVQFHPEKSGIVGEKVLYNFLNVAL